MQRNKIGSLIWLYNIQRDLKFKNFNCVFWKVCWFIKLNGVSVIHNFSWICNLTKPNIFLKIKPQIWYSLRNNYTEYSSMSSRLIHLFARAIRGKKIKYCLGCYALLSRFSLKRIYSMLHLWNFPWKDLDH